MALKAQIAILELQLKEQKNLVSHYRKELCKKDEQLLDLESMFVNSIVGDITDEMRGK